MADSRFGTDDQIKFFYKHAFLGSCDPDYVECDAVLALLKSDTRAATQVLNYLNSLGDPVFPTEPGGYTRETDVSKVDIDDLYTTFMRELEYEYADDLDAGFGFVVDSDAPGGWDFEIFDGPVAEENVVSTTKIKASRYDNVPGYKAPTGGYLYIFKHGIGPGTMPKDVEIVKTKDLPNGYTAVWLSDFLTTDELKKYDIPAETEITRYLNRIGYCQKNGDVVPCDDVDACNDITASTKYPTIPAGWERIPEGDDAEGNWGTIAREMPNHDGYYWIDICEDDNSRRCFKVSYAYRTSEGSVGTIIETPKEYYRLGDALKNVDNRIAKESNDIDASTEVNASTVVASEPDFDVMGLVDQFFTEVRELVEYFRYHNKNLNRRQDELIENLSDALDSRSTTAAREAIENLNYNTKGMYKAQEYYVTDLYTELCYADGKYSGLGRNYADDAINGSTKYTADMCSVGASDDGYAQLAEGDDADTEEYIEGGKYYVAGYLYSSYRGLMEDMYSDDFEEILTNAADMAGQGLYVEITNRADGRSERYTPEDFEEAASNGEYPDHIREDLAL